MKRSPKSDVAMRRAGAAIRAVSLLADIMAEGQVLFLVDEGMLPELIKAMRQAGVTYKQMPLIEGES